MGTVYGGYSAGWKPKGSSTSKQYRAYLNYWESARTNTSITFGANMGVNLSSSVTKDGYGAQLRATGANTVTASGSTTYGEATTVSFIGTRYYTYERREQPYTITIYGDVRCATSSGSGGWTNAWSTAGITLTVPAREYDITFNANGGSNPPGVQKKTHGVALTLSSIIPTRDGYDFVKWNTSADGTGTSYQSGSTMPANVNQDTTLYAIWHKSYVPPTISNLRAYRVGASVTGKNPAVLSTGTRCYCDFDYVASVSPDTVLNSITIKFGSASAINASTSGSTKYGYSATNHLPTTSKEEVVVTVKVTDYKGVAHTYTYSTYISIENYVFDAFKGTSGSTEYQSFAIGGIARDFSNSDRSSKGNFDIYMDVSIVLNNCTITDSGTALSVTAGASTDDGKLAQAVIDAFDYEDAKEILEL